jgi:hypothetical protein
MRGRAKPTCARACEVENPLSGQRRRERPIFKSGQSMGSAARFGPRAAWEQQREHLAARPWELFRVAKEDEQRVFPVRAETSDYQLTRRSDFRMCGRRANRDPAGHSESFEALRPQR